MHEIGVEQALEKCAPCLVKLGVETIYGRYYDLFREEDVPEIYNPNYKDILL